MKDVAFSDIAVDREVLRANPIEDVAYEQKEAPKLRHISRSELKQMMETPLPDPMYRNTI